MLLSLVMVFEAYFTRPLTDWIISTFVSSIPIPLDTELLLLPEFLLSPVSTASLNPLIFANLASNARSGKFSDLCV